jgi:type IV secretory pathway TraG/TraD family ATPase VirD4
MSENRKIIFLISEAAQIGRLNGVVAAVGQGRKYNIRLVQVWQNNDQMEVYGPKGASTLIANSGAVFAFNPGHGPDAEFLSRLSGEHLVPGYSATDDPQRGGDRGTIAPQRERLWSPERIRSLPERHGLVWKTGRAEPQPVYCPPYWDIKACRRIARQDPFHGPMPPRQTGKIRRAFPVAFVAAGLILALVVLLHH